MRKSIVAVAWCVWAVAVHGQFDLGGAKTHEKRHPHSFWLEVPFSNEDLAIGGVYRYSVHADQFLGLYAAFQGRPFGKKILLQDGPNFFFQLKEYRYVISAGLDKKFWINNRMDFFVGGGAGLTLVDYRGTGEGIFMGHKIVKKEGFVPMAKAGFSFKINRYVFLRAGYTYFDARTLPGHRVSLSLGGQL